MLVSGIPIVVSAPSGTGKTSLIRRVLETLSNVALSVSHTTRAPRGEEVDGRDYHFVGATRFEEMVHADAFVEWAEVFGRRYGTGEEAVRKQLSGGLDVLLDIDVQGGLQIRERFDTALLVFLLPPSMAELRRRLVNRGTDAPEVIKRRLGEARAEIAQCRAYDYLVVNDDFEHAASELRAIIGAARRQASRNPHLVDALLVEEAGEPV